MASGCRGRSPATAPRFAAAFPGEADPVTYDNVAQAIGAFERRLVTPSRWDEFLGRRRRRRSPRRSRRGPQHVHRHRLPDLPQRERRGRRRCTRSSAWSSRGRTQDDLGRYDVTRRTRPTGWSSRCRRCATSRRRRRTSTTAGHDADAGGRAHGPAPARQGAARTPRCSRSRRS